MTRPTVLRRSLVWSALAFAAPASLAAQRTSAAITAADLKTRLYLIADDSMGGRATGSRGNFLAAEYVANEFRRLGIKPGGENGTYYQTVPFLRLRVDPASQLTVGMATLRLGPDYIVGLNRSAPRSLDGRTAVYGGNLADSSTWISAEAARDHIVVLAVPPGGLNLGALFGPLSRAKRFADAAAVAVPVRDQLPPELAASQLEGRVTTDTARSAAGPVTLFTTKAAAEALIGRPLGGAQPGAPGPAIKGDARLEYAPLPFAARNVIGILTGTDRAAAATYVSISAHNDHVGFDHFPVDHDSLRAFNRVMRPMGADTPVREATTADWAKIRKILDSLRAIRPPRPDSIRNGADDDGSGTAVLLEVAERLAADHNLRRSVLFVSHAAEEEGLLGSRWFTDHPTVPRDSIVSEFDMDQVARGDRSDLPDGGPDYLEMIGMRRLSKEYGDLIEAANRRQPEPFHFNLAYDAPGHPLQYYCRADHYSYARYDIPSIAISRGEHLDYHQVTDEPQYANYQAMERVGRFAADVISSVANLDHRPKVDFPKHDPNARCVQ